MSYDPERRTQQFEILGRVLPLARDIRRIGAASLDLAFVAAGNSTRTTSGACGRGIWPRVRSSSARPAESSADWGNAAGRDLLIAASSEFYGSLEAVLAR